SIQPYKLYKSYEAYESSSVTNWYYNSNYRRKDARKSKTHFYDRMDYSQFDEIMNPADPRVNMEFVLELQFMYYIKKPYKKKTKIASKIEHVDSDINPKKKKK
ncbi:MAG: hypothetical protein MRY83_03545, partial [Flavobacteriales bacterium]|nr:hypothetical protein [Flavobacteriales bacterium]